MLLALVQFSLAFEIESASFVAKVEEITGRFSLLWRYSSDGYSGSKSVLPWASPPPSFVYIEVDGVGAIIDGRMVPVVKPPVRKEGSFEGFFSFEGLHIRQKLFLDSSIFCEEGALTFSFSLRNPGKAKKVKLAYVLQVPEDSFVSSPLEGTVAFAGREVFKLLGKVPPYLLFNWEDTPSDLSMAVVLEGRALTPDEVVLSDFSEVSPNPFRMIDSSNEKSRSCSKSKKLSGRRALTLLWSFDVPQGKVREIRFSFSTARWRRAEIRQSRSGSGEASKVLYLAPIYYSFPFPLALRFGGLNGSKEGIKIEGVEFEKGYFLKVAEFRGKFFISDSYDELISLVLFPDFGSIASSGEGSSGKESWMDRIFLKTTLGMLSIPLKIEKESLPLRGETLEFLGYSGAVRKRALSEKADRLKESREPFNKAEDLSKSAEKLLREWRFEEAYNISVQIFEHYDESYRKALLTWDFLRKKVKELFSRVEPLEEDPLKDEVLAHLKEAKIKVESKDPDVENDIPRLEREVEYLVEVLYWKKVAREGIVSAEEIKEKALSLAADRINSTEGLFDSAEVFLSLAISEFERRCFKESAADARRACDLFQASYSKALSEWNSLEENLRKVSSVRNHPGFDSLGNYLLKIWREAARLAESRDPRAFVVFYQNFPWLMWYSRSVPDLWRNFRLFQRVAGFYPGFRKLLCSSERKRLDDLLCRACRAFSLRQYRVSMYYLEALLSSIEGFLHRVRRGDTLWDIAKKYYRNPIGWKRIYYANKQSIRHPHWIYPGQQFFVPLNVRSIPGTILDEETVLKIFGYDFPSDYEEVLKKYPIRVPFASLSRICSRKKTSLKLCPGGRFRIVGGFASEGGIAGFDADGAPLAQDDYFDPPV